MSVSVTKPEDTVYGCLGRKIYVQSLFFFKKRTVFRFVTLVHILIEHEAILMHFYFLFILRTRMRGYITGGNKEITDERNYYTKRD
jgi:hypothetical protein